MGQISRPALLFTHAKQLYASGLLLYAFSGHYEVAQRVPFVTGAHTPDPFPFELGRLGKQKGTDQWMCFFGKHVHEHDDLILVGSKL